MDANPKTPRKTVTVSIAGRELEMFVPSNNQLVGLSMIQSAFFPDGQKLTAMTDMFLMLLPDDDARGWFMSNLLADKYSLEDMAATISRVATAPTAKPAKKTAKKVG